jgi:hypothetical protein
MNQSALHVCALFFFQNDDQIEFEQSIDNGFFFILIDIRKQSKKRLFSPSFYFI